jgi:ATP-utilising chromatin assembly and remodelling N-terminal
MTYQEAMESEDKAYSFLTSNFPVVFEKPVLELVHHSK